MTVLVGVLLIAAWLALTLVLPLVAAAKARRAAREAELLRHEVARLGDEVQRLRAAVGATTPPPPAPDVPTFEPALPPPSRDAAPVPPRQPVSLETRIGAQWLLYAGVATLVLGASYFVKYAFENDWITPGMRVVLGAVAGLGLVEGGRRFSRSGLTLYGQMIGAGGLAILYVSVYAALNLYGLVNPPVAFALMAAVTGLAAARAHREVSQGLAVLAVTGGFLTPFLVGGDTDTQHVLFAYDAILVAGTLWLARHHRWPALHLVSFTLAVVTIATWADRHYAPARWLATELWLTLFVTLFVVIWRTLPPGRSAGAQLARLVLGAAPLLYHGASLRILWGHTPALLVYLIAATVVGIVAGQARRPWVRLATWALVALPTLGWLATRPARWDSAPFVALFGIYLLHLVAQVREVGASREPPSAKEVLLVHANGLWLWGGLALLLEKLALAQLGPATFGLATWNAVVAAGLLRRNHEAMLHFVALAGALCATAVVVEFDGAAVTVAWAAEGAAIVALGLLGNRQWLRFTGWALLVAAIERLVYDLLQPAAATATIVFNERAMTALLVVALLVLLAWWYGRRPPSRGLLPVTQIVAATIVTGCVLALLWATSEVNAWFAQRAWSAAGAGGVTAAGLARQVTLSTLWAGYALGLVAIGIRRRYQPLRALAITLFAVTAAKVFFVDLARLDRFYRILSTVGLGLLLLGASFLYQRFAKRSEEA